MVNIIFKKAGDEIKRREKKEGKLTPHQKAKIIFQLVAHYPYKLTYSLTEAIKSRGFECNLKAIIAASLLRKLVPEIKVFGVLSFGHVFLGLQIGKDIYIFDPTNHIFESAPSSLSQTVHQYIKSGQIASRRTTYIIPPSYRYIYYEVGQPEKIFLSSLLYNISSLNSAPYLQKQITESSIRINPLLDLPLNTLGTMFFDTAQFQKAQDYYRKSTSINPQYYNPYNNIGVIYDELGRYNEAIKYYKMALILKPAYSSPWENLADLFLSLNEYQKATICYQMALRYTKDPTIKQNILEKLKQAKEGLQHSS